MRLRTLSLIVVVVLTGSVSLAPQQSKFCKYWCKSNDDSFYYCCPDEKLSENFLASSMWPIMSSPMFWFAVISTTIGAQAHHHNNNRHEIESIITPKKYCPPMRSSCLRSFDEWYEPPNSCATDDDCDNSAKCCYDVCLEHKTCKPAK